MVIEKAAQSPIYTYRNQNLKINYYDPYPYCIGAEKILGLVTQENLPPYWYEALPKNLVKNVKIKKEDFKNNNSNYFLTPFKGIDTIQLKNPILGILQLKKKILGEKYLFSLNAHTLLQGNVEKWMQKLEPLHYKESAFKINLLNSPSLF